MNILKSRVAPLAAAFITALLAALIFLATHDWFGAGDLSAFAFWSVLLLLPLHFLFRGFIKLSVRWSALAQYIVASCVGLLVGFMWTMGVAAFLGPMFFAFSFPVGFCWLLGTLSGFLALVATHRRRTWPVAAALTLIIGVTLYASLVGIFQSSPALKRPPNFVIVIRDDATNQQVNQIWEEGIATPTGKGSALLDGISGAWSRTYQGHEAILLTFAPGTSDSQREYIRSRVLQMSTVVEVIEVEGDVQ